MIRIGTAGWSFKEWKGIVYPPRLPRGFHELSFLAEFFDAIEINSSFYRPLSQHVAASWVEKVEKNKIFRFTAKLWRGFTHDRSATSDDEQRVKNGLEPLVEAGRLGAVLLQFPPSFRNTPEHGSYLEELYEKFAGYPLILETRHSSWNDPAVLRSLQKLGIGFCNTDQLVPGSTSLSTVVTSQTGYVRLHGRNYANAGTKEQYPGQRYDYLYSPEELDSLLGQINAVAAGTTETYVIANNTYKGKGAVNALEIASLLAAKPVPAPPLLIAAYPVLKGFTDPSPEDFSLLPATYPSRTH